MTAKTATRRAIREFIREEEAGAVRDEASFVCDACGEAVSGEDCFAVETGDALLRFCPACAEEPRTLAEHLDMLGIAWERGSR